MSIAPKAGAWESEDLRHLRNQRELEIAAPFRDGRPGSWTPVWVVVADEEVFVRTWQRRSTGWYGRAIAAKRATIRISGRVVNVTVDVVATTGDDAVSGAYRTKYGPVAAESMVTNEAVASTLRLARAI